MLIRVQDESEESQSDSVQFQEVRQADLDIWEQVTPEAPLLMC